MKTSLLLPLMISVYTIADRGGTAPTKNGPNTSCPKAKYREFFCIFSGHSLLEGVSAMYTTFILNSYLLSSLLPNRCPPSPVTNFSKNFPATLKAISKRFCSFHLMLFGKL